MPRSRICNRRFHMCTARAQTKRLPDGPLRLPPKPTELRVNVFGWPASPEFMGLQGKCLRLGSSGHTPEDHQIWQRLIPTTTMLRKELGVSGGNVGYIFVEQWPHAVRSWNSPAIHIFVHVASLRRPTRYLSIHQL